MPDRWRSWRTPATTRRWSRWPMIGAGCFTLILQRADAIAQIGQNILHELVVLLGAANNLANQVALKFRAVFLEAAEGLLKVVPEELGRHTLWSVVHGRLSAGGGTREVYGVRRQKEKPAPG